MDLPHLHPQQVVLQHVVPSMVGLLAWSLGCGSRLVGLNCIWERPVGDSHFQQASSERQAASRRAMGGPDLGCAAPDSPPTWGRGTPPRWLPSVVPGIAQIGPHCPGSQKRK